MNAAGAAPVADVALAEIRDLIVEFAPTRRSAAHQIGPVSLTIRTGDRIGVVGRSGAGKSTIGASLLALLPASAKVIQGEVLIEGQSLFTLSPQRLRALRGSRVAMVFQDCTTAMDPLRRLDRAFAGVIRAHRTCSRAEIEQRTRAALTRAQLDPDQCLRRYPHELSGGMRQRAMIALAMVNGPDLLVADEPTTALDPSIQLAILELLRALSAGTGLVMITHDLKVARNLCTQIAVMDDGMIVEAGPTEQIMSDPQHAHTRELLSAGQDGITHR